ncbi:MAG TPA: hypothetical protein VMA34_18150 [Terracidiphilus sp.]|nr:hypothetical protein [Terracidiphilus sp.]
MRTMDEVRWIESHATEKLAIVLRPRGGEWLRDELLRFKEDGLETLVSLLEPREAEWLGLAEEGRLAEEAGLHFLCHPIRDTCVPSDVASFREFVIALAERLRKGEHIGVHCRGSIGRATLTAACTLVELGWKPIAALFAIETARGCPVPDTEEQLHWILNYKAQE